MIANSFKIEFGISASLVFLMLLCGCSGSKNNFKGTWHFENYTVEEGEKQGNAWTVWLDLADSNVSRAGYEDVPGVVMSDLEDSFMGGRTYARITEAEVDGNVANIKYEHAETGEIWKATLTFNPSDSTLSWKSGGLYKMGPRSRKETLATDADMVFYLEPEDALLKKVSHMANYIDENNVNVVLKMPGRIYYRDEFSRPDSVGNWNTKRQLRCLFDTDDDIEITDKGGNTLWDEDYMANITDAWPLPDNSGMMCICWSGGTAYQEITLYRVGSDNLFEKIDHVEGSGSNPIGWLSDEERARYEDEIVSSTPQISKMGEKVRVFDPENKEARYYDLSGNRR